VSNVVAPPAFGDTRRRLVGQRSERPQAAPSQEFALDMALRAMKSEIAELQQQLAARDAEIEAQASRMTELEQRIDAAREAGIAEGREAGIVAGRERAQLDHRERNLALAAATVDALRAHEAALSQLGDLAVPIALAALERIAGDSSARKDLVTAIVAEQLDRLRDAAPVRVRVAAVDFPDTDDLRKALPAKATGAVEVAVDSGLCSGQVRIELKLGQVDAGLDRQLAAVYVLLQGSSDAA
jgi:flagellar biosynthesis/type III secretory pathway protein FliH